MRIEIIPKDWETSEEKARGDGTPAIDLCRICSFGFVEVHPLISPELRLRFPGSLIGSVDVEHPPYTDDNYKCDLCDEPLDEKD